MAHQLSELYIDGELRTDDAGAPLWTMAYAEGGAVPWHRLGQVIPAGSDLAYWAQWAGLDYRVECRPNCRADGSPIPASFHIAREDNGAILGAYVAGQYQPFQNADAMALVEKICERYGFRIDTAGALFDGAKAWVQIKTDVEAELPGGDVISNSIVVAPYHTGRNSTRIISTQTRVVCDNTLSYAIAKADASDDADAAAKYHHRVIFDDDAIVEAVGQNEISFREFSDVAAKMAERILTDAERLDYFQDVLGGAIKTGDNGVVTRSVAVRRAMAFASGRDFVAEGKAAPDVVRVVDEAIERARRGSASDAAIVADDIANDDVAINPGHDLASAKGTLFGALNTVTWMCDHAPTKDRGLEHKMSSNIFGDGTGAKIKSRAMTEARELLAA